MNKKEIYAAFNGCISRTAIVRTDGEPGTYKIIGKYAEIEPMDDGSWDVWITDTSSPAATLTNQKVTHMLKKLVPALQLDKTGTLRIYDGEASFQLVKPEDLVEHLRTLGIRRTRKMSDEQKRKAAERFARLRAAA